MTDLTPEQEAKLLASLKPKVSVEVTNLAGVEPRRQPFLWNPYLPLGSLVIVAGAPGHGKSQLAALMAAMASRGSFYPGDVVEPSRVLMLCAEDRLDTTVVPRLLAVNADVRLIDTINLRTVYPDGLTAKGMIRLPGDAGLVHRWVRDNATARFIVMDPVASFFDRSHSTLFNQDVRDALGPLVAIAETYGTTIVVVLHLNKSESKDFSGRIAESHGFQALARSIMALGPDPDDPQGDRGSKKVLAVTKANLVKPGTYSLRCEVRSVELSQFTPPIETSELALIGKCDVTADDLLAPGAERSTRIEAGSWLAEFLDGGWRKVSDVRKAAISDGFSWRMMERVRTSQGFQRAKQQGVKHGPWWIGAPEAHARDLPPASGGVGDLGGLEGGQGSQGSQDRPRQGEDPRAQGNGKGDLDAYREWERRKLGERDDD
jgi:hypothetical protein